MTTDNIIANFMAASRPLEEYLQQGEPLTDLQLKSVNTTIGTLQLLLDTWRGKHG